MIGRTLQCPNCHGAFVVPGNVAETEGDQEAFPLPAIVAIVIAAHIIGVLVVAMATNWPAALTLLFFAMLIELAVWKRKEFFASISSLQESQTTKRAIQSASAWRSSGADVSRPPPPQSQATSDDAGLTVAELVDEPDDELVEVRPARPAASRPRVAAQSTLPPRHRERAPMWGQIKGRPLNARIPKGNVYFFGPGTELDLGRGVLQVPLVYATGAAQRGEFDASLIDATLPVAPPGSPVHEELPYWPSYYDCSPAQRSQYLDWLLSGKQDPRIALGYVFIYFYGLERRSLVDQTDHVPIAQELIRLLPIYDSSNSFRRYASSLLWLTLYLANQQQLTPEAFLSGAEQVTSRWNEGLLRYCLATYHVRNQPLPARLALAVSQHDPRSTSSVIVRRHREEFEKLFEQKYHERFGNGIQLKASKRPKRLDYHPASGTLLRSLGTANEIGLPNMPDVLAISSQFKPLIEIWEQCIAELRAFSRAAKASGGELTADAYEALPPELREDEHPEFPVWMKAWEENVDEEGWPIVPVSRLAEIKGLPTRDRLTKAQCRKLLQSADAMGLGVEPDARMLGKNYRWDERVTLFFLDDEADGEDPTNYVAAAILLRLGAAIAEADGQVAEEELRFITEHLEGQFNLSDGHSKRLERLQYLLLHSQSGDNKITAALAKRLPREHRRIVGDFLVGVAAVDEVITREEVKALRKAFRSLDLDVADIDPLLAAHAPSKDDAGKSTKESGELHLDMQAISRIMAETQQVAGILSQAMAEEDEEEDAARRPTGADMAAATATPSVATTTPPAPDASIAAELQTRYQPFLSAVLQRDEWTEDEIRELADKAHVMLSGAIEVVNEWSTDRFGDWLIIEGETYHVRRDLIQE